MAVLEETGLRFPMMWKKKPSHHGTVSAYALYRLFKKQEMPPEWAWSLSAVLGGHHGIWPEAAEINAYSTTSDLGDADWDDMRTWLFAMLEALYMPPVLDLDDDDTLAHNTLLTIACGLLTVPNWLGSMRHLDAGGVTCESLRTYASQAHVVAHETLSEVGFEGWRVPEHVISMQAIHAFSALRPLQQFIADHASAMSQPGVVIIEAPTGVGKTEAALFLADRWAQTLQQNGFYVAMPTMATSNQMYDRVRKVLERRYPNEAINYQLLHDDIFPTRVGVNHDLQHS